MKFTVGQRVRFEAEFRDEGGKPFDPKSVTVTVKIARPDGTTTAETMTLDKGVQRKRRGAFFVFAVMSDDGELTVRFEGGKDEGFSVFRAQVGELEPETGAEDQLANEADPSHAAGDDASDLEDPPLTQDAELGDGEMREFLASRGVAVDPAKSPAYVKSMFDAYGGGGTTRADVADTNRGHAIEELKRTIAKGKTAGERSRAARGFIERARPSNPRR